jgi:release factor glutamine methyltransferase
MTLRNFIDHVMEQLAPLYPQQECKAMAVRMLKELLVGYKGYEHMLEPATELDTFQLEGTAEKNQPSQQHSGTVKYLLSCVERLATGEPLQYVMGFEWFCGHKFNVAPGVLIPRPETEELVNKAIEFAQAAALQPQSTTPLRILDICTGSGCIAWSLAAALPQSEVYACDISRQALQIARAQQIQCADNTPAKVKFQECDILSQQAQQKIAQACGEGEFNLIISNPPYVCECEKSQMRENVLNHEPHLALFVPDNDPLKFYRAIAQLSGRILAPGGALMFEINERFGTETAQMMQQMGYTNCQVLQDLFGKDRMVVGYKESVSL